MTTAQALQAITAALSGMMLAIIWSLRRCGLPGVREWWQSNLIVTLSLVLFALRGLIPDPVSIVVANAAMAWSLALFHAGVLRFLGKTPWWRTMAAGTVATMTVIVICRYVYDDLNIRVVGVSVFHCFGLATAGYMLMRHRPSDRAALPYLTTAIFALLFATGHAVRGLGSALAWLEYPGVGPSPGFSVGFLTIGALVMPAITMGAVLMTHDAIVRRLEDIADTDFLTGVLSRKAFEERAQQALDAAAASGAPIVLLMLDIDRFKRVNDGYGHPAGDAVIAAFAETALANVRGADLVGRMGGEEFLVLLTSAGLNEARLVAERIRADAEGSPVTGPFGAVTYTVSGGYSLWQPGESLARLVARADTALYAAKLSGRNRMQPHVGDAHIVSAALAGGY